MRQNQSQIFYKKGTIFNTEAKQSFEPLAIQHKQRKAEVGKNLNFEKKTRLIKIFVCLDLKKLGAQLMLEVCVQ